MKNCKLSKDEQQRRKELATHVREMICEQMSVEAQDETSLMMGYRDYYLQISFSDLHPLMVFCLAKALIKPSTVKQQRMANDLNLRSILGSHAINEEVGCYSYRATHWLDAEMEPERFFEILNRCVDEANKGFLKLAG